MLRWPFLAMLLIQEVYLDSLLDSAAFQELKSFSVSVAVVTVRKLNQSPFFVADGKWLISNMSWLCWFFMRFVVSYDFSCKPKYKMCNDMIFKSSAYFNQYWFQYRETDTYYNFFILFFVLCMVCNLISFLKSNIFSM